MNRNITAKILSLLMTAVMVISLFGCSVSKKNEVTDKDANAISFDDKTNKDGDAVIKNEVTDKDGKKTEVTQLVDASKVDKPIYAESGITKRDDFVKTIAKEDYNMPEDVAKQVAEKPEAWKEFYSVEYIQNKSDKHLACRSISVENNGSNGLWINTRLDADYTFAPGTTDAISIWVVVDSNKLTDGDAIDEAFNNTKINLVYTLIDDPTEDVDWDHADIKELTIH